MKDGRYDFFLVVSQASVNLLISQKWKEDAVALFLVMGFSGLHGKSFNAVSGNIFVSPPLHIKSYILKFGTKTIN